MTALDIIGYDEAAEEYTYVSLNSVCGPSQLPENGQEQPLTPRGTMAGVRISVCHSTICRSQLGLAEKNLLTLHS